VYKLITILVAAIPIVLFLRAIFPGQSKAMKQAISDFRKQIDYLISVILVAIACGIIYSLGTLIYFLWNG
jgi:hypothetical protein